MLFQSMRSPLSCSSHHPLFFLEISQQWAERSALDIIYAILSDARGSSSFFFVGSYRDNEVSMEDPVFDLIASLDLCGVATTHIRLAGLGKEDLNVMLSESLCTFPRVCKPLSDIVHEKTEGNP